jgi:drug/metabolite transporter (DMT)-like permease
MLMQVATVGLSITIPLAMLSDFLIFGAVPSGMAFGGAAMVLVGFFCVTYKQENSSTNDRKTSGAYRSQNGTDAGIDHAVG